MWILFWLYNHLDKLYYVSAILLFGVFFFTLVINRKQLHFHTAQKCFELYRKEFMTLGWHNYEEYFDFVNEELFYIQNRQINKEVAIEWIDGMIDNMPVYYKDKEKPVNVNAINIEIEKRIKNYPRLKIVFTINEKSCYDNFDGVFKNYSERSENDNMDRLRLMNEIYYNARNYENYKVEIS